MHRYRDGVPGEAYGYLWAHLGHATKNVDFLEQSAKVGNAHGLYFLYLQNKKNISHLQQSADLGYHLAEVELAKTLLDRNYCGYIGYMGRSIFHGHYDSDFLKELTPFFRILQKEPQNRVQRLRCITFIILEKAGFFTCLDCLDFSD